MNIPNKCPRCGSVVFVRVGPNRWRCIICGYEVVFGGSVSAVADSKDSSKHTASQTSSK
jgi:ribosomal protein L37AE/L43A